MLGRSLGNGRFELVRLLGSGGMGVVWLARDTEDGRTLALKTIPEPCARDISRLKHEFRSLSGLRHPSFVVYQDLFVDHSEAFFTMEYVDGLPFDRCVRGCGALGLEMTVELPNAGLRIVDPEPPPTETPPDPISSSGVERLIRLAPALFEAVYALHRRGRLHRDLKPGNVLVTSRGRVVLLDFGLALNLEGNSGPHSDEGRIQGTVGYMSPEQAEGGEQTTASDLYSLGVMLYEAATGQLPHRGSFLQQLYKKVRVRPPSPLSLGAPLPPELDSLIMDLLDPDPTQRPDAAQALARLGRGQANDRADTSSVSLAGLGVPFVGRSGPLRELEQARKAVALGSPRVVQVVGHAGMGKSALLREFSRRTAAREGSVVLRARCHPEERVPYQALDGVIDGLSRWLSRRAAAEVVPLVPRHVRALALAFPALRRLESLAAPGRQEREVEEPEEQRRRAFLALREVLARLADRYSVLLEIDDFHWADTDSLTLLRELLRGPDAPALLYVLSSRPNPAAPPVEALGRLVRDLDVDRRRVELQRLTDGEVGGIVRSLLDAETDRWTPIIQREAAGRPLFVAELVHGVQDPDGPPDPLTLAAVLERRLASLPPGYRLALELLAVAGRPLSQAVLARAVRLDDEGIDLGLLRSQHLVRRPVRRAHRRVELLHGALKALLLEPLGGDDVAERHLLLAEALEGVASEDAESLALHWHGAGNAQRTARYAEQAGRAAMNGLAFERASAWYRLALSACDDRELRAGLQRLLGSALAQAGRGLEAAEAWSGAAEFASGRQRALDLRLAGQQCIFQGRVVRGVALLEEALGGRGLERPTTTALLAVRLLAARARLPLAREGSASRPEKAAEFDELHGIASALMLVDPLRGAHLHALTYRLAIELGEPGRLARALAAEAAWQASRSAPGPRLDGLLDRARSLAASGPGRVTRAAVSVQAALAEWHRGRWVRAGAEASNALALLQRQSITEPWLVPWAWMVRLEALWWRGEIARLLALLPVVRENARQRGDAYLTGLLRGHFDVLAALAIGQPDEAEAALQDFDPAGTGQLLAGLLCGLGTVEVALYRGDAAAADAALKLVAGSPQFRLLQHARQLRVRYLFARGRVSLLQGGGSWRASRCAAQLESEGPGWTTALGALLRSGVAAGSGDPGRLGAKLLRAERGAASAGLGGYEQAARLLRSGLLVGAEGPALRRSSLSALEAQGVGDPAGWVASLLPPFSRPEDDGEPFRGALEPLPQRQ